MDILITRPGLVVPVRPDPTGRNGPTPRQVRSKRWRRTSPGYYVPADTPRTVEQRILEAAVGAPGASVTGWAALHWWGGVRWFSGRAADGGELSIPLALDDQRRLAPRPGVKLVEDWLFADDVVVVDGIRVVRPERALSHEVRRAPGVVAAVQAIDMAAYHDLVDLASMAAHTLRLPSRPGVRLLRQALSMSEENVWSPQETTMRLLWTETDARCRLLCNVPVFDETGRHLFTPDLLDVTHGLVGEYDGPTHLVAVQRRIDLDRHEHVLRHGLEPVTMVAGDAREPSAFRRRLVGAHERAASRESDVPWTIEQPRWWVDTSTVARRRALGERDRTIWLRHRAA